MIVFLIGLPGSGKSTLGQRLAQRIGYSFTDLDAQIEKQEGQSIPEIFRQKGEAFFRSIEANALDEVVQSGADQVVATGGGAPCFFDGMEKMNKGGVTVFLDVSIPTLVNRLETSDYTGRPLLTVPSYETVTQRLVALRQQRLPVYRQAAIILTSDQLSVDQLEQALALHLKT